MMIIYCILRQKLCNTTSFYYGYNYLRVGSQFSGNFLRRDLGTQL